MQHTPAIHHTQGVYVEKQDVHALTQAAALAPGTEPAAQAVRELVRESTAPNTSRSYASAVRYLAAWHALRYGDASTPLLLEDAALQGFAEEALPMPVERAVQFVVDHLGRTSADGTRAWELPADVDAALVAAGAKRKSGPLSLATVEHRLAVLSALHQARHLANPCEAGPVRLLLQHARRAAHRRGEAPRKKRALPARDLLAMIATCDDSLQGLRDRALLYFGFASGGRRRSEIADAVVDDLERTGADSYVYRLRRSKTRTHHTDRAAEKPVVGDAARALADWLGASGIESGPLFRRIRGGTIGAEGLSGRAVAEIIQRRAAAAGIEGDIGGHSLRSGFVTEAGRRGVPVPEAMALTDHRSAQTFLSYYQAGAVEGNAAARLLDAGDDENR